MTPDSLIRAVVHRATAIIGATLKISLIFSVAVMLASVTLQVVMRYVFSRPPSWTDELAILTFSWLAFGGLAYGVFLGFHVRLTFGLDALPPTLRRLNERAIYLLTAAFGGYLFWSGARFVDFTLGGTSAAIRYPIELLHSMAPVSGALVFIFALAHAAFPPDKPTAEPIGVNPV